MLGAALMLPVFINASASPAQAPEPPSGVYVIEPDGTNERRLMRTSSPDVSWAPDGTAVALAVGSMFSEGDDLFIVPVDGRPARRLTRTTALTESEPAWSPDGQSIAYSAVNERVFAVRSRIWVVKVNGTGRTRLSPLTDLQEIGPVWAPDSRRLAFLGDISAYQFNIFTIRPNGTGRTRLTRTLRAEEWGPAWAPDGRQIAFVRSTNSAVLNETTFDVWVMSSTGSHQRRVVPKDVAFTAPGWAAPAWAPDSRHLAFSSRGSVWVVDVDGRERRRLRTTVPSRELAWSPDGARIAFLGVTGNQTDLYVIGADGTGERRLTHTRIDELHPVWSPAGTSIAFARLAY